MKRVFCCATAVACFTALAVFSSCDDDSPTGTPATTGSISGKVTFTGTWPDVGDIQVSIYSTLVTPPGVPGGPPEAFTDPLSETTEYTYRISGIDPGDYPAVFVGWRDPADPSGAKLIGTYWIYPDSLGIAASGLPKPPGPSTVTVDKGATTSGLDIVADLDLAGP